MEYFRFLPSIVYALLILMALAVYLIESYLVQIESLKIIYILSALGLAIHFPFVLEFNILKKYKKVTFFLDIVLLSLVVYFIPSGQSFLLFFILIYIFYSGLAFSHNWMNVASVYFVIFFSTYSYISNYQITLPIILWNLVFATSVFIVNIMSRSVSDTFHEQKKQNLRLQKINEGVFQSVPLGLIVTQHDGSIVHSNPFTMDIFYKLKSATLNNQNNDHFLESLVTPYEILPELRSIEEGDRIGIDIIRRVKDGFLFLKAKVISIFNSVKEEQLLLYIIEDRTDIEKKEMEKRQSEKLAAIGTLAAGIAHEIRNPLTGISGALQLLELNINSEESKRLTKIVYREINRLNTLISEFLDFAKPDLAPPSDEVNITKILKDCFWMVTQDERFSFLKNLSFPEIDNHFILGNEDKLKQLFLNILVNAAQALEFSEKKELNCSIYLKDDWVVIKIQDSGVGMDEITLKKIFEPFHTTKEKGTGLGMAISLKIVQNHRGQIHVYSKPKEGSLVEICFPRIRR